MQDHSLTSRLRKLWDITFHSEAPTYTPVNFAGHGLFGQVYFCLPTDQVFLARRSAVSDNTTTTTQQSLHSLTSKLVAVKTAGAVSLIPEIRALRTIHTQQHSSDVVEKSFFRLIESRTDGDLAQYMVTSTLPLCGNLDELGGCIAQMPEAFTWLIYTRIHSALRFLHKTCSPAIAHGDLHQGNVLIGFSDPDVKGRGLILPQVTLIDFGNATFHPGEERSGNSYRDLYGVDAFSRDTDAFLRILESVASDPRPHEFDRSDYKKWWDRKKWEALLERKPLAGRTAEFNDFHKALGHGLAQGLRVNPVVLEELWKSFGSFAEQCVADISEADMEQIRDLVLGVAETLFEETRESIEEILMESE